MDGGLEFSTHPLNGVSTVVLADESGGVLVKRCFCLSLIAVLVN